MSISMKCPACHTRFSFEESASGAQPTCPNCKQQILASNAAPVPPELPPLSNAPQTQLMTGIIAVATVCLIAVSLIAYNVISAPVEQETVKGPPPPKYRPEGPLDVAYLDPDSELFMMYRPDVLWNSELVVLLDMLPEMKYWVQQMLDQTGLTPSDIQTITIGIPGVSEVAERGRAGIAELPQKNGVMVVRTDTDVSDETLTKLGGQPKSFEDGTPYFLFENTIARSSPFVVCRPESKLLVLASEDTLPLSLQQRDAVPREQLKFVDGAADVTLALAPLDRTRIVDSIPSFPPNGPVGLYETLDAMRGVATGVCFTVALDELLQLRLAIDCQGASGKGTLPEALSKFIAEFAFVEIRDDTSQADIEFSDFFDRIEMMDGPRQVHLRTQVPPLSEAGTKMMLNSQFLYISLRTLASLSRDALGLGVPKTEEKSGENGEEKPAGMPPEGGKTDSPQTENQESP